VSYRVRETEGAGGFVMTLKALDLQVLFPKIQEVGRIQQVLQGNELAQQQSFAAHFLQYAEAAQRKIQHTPQAREGLIRGRKRKGDSPAQESGQRAARKKERPDRDLDQGLEQMPSLGHIIDLKI
jgi:hypothetical protein